MVVPSLHVLAGAVEEADGQDEDMVGLTVVAGHFAEWTDARRVVVAPASAAAAAASEGGSVAQQMNEEKKNIEVAEAVVAVAIEALEKFCSNGTSSKHHPLKHFSFCIFVTFYIYLLYLSITLDNVPPPPFISLDVS